MGTSRRKPAGRAHAETVTDPSGPASQNDFFQKVWDVVAMIPDGYVTTYGHIAEYLGARSSARTVGWALAAAAGTGLPCHRVVNRFGALSGKLHFEGPYVMEERLRNEGITFTEEDCVDLSRHLWEPGKGEQRQLGVKDEK